MEDERAAYLNMLPGIYTRQKIYPNI